MTIDMNSGLASTITALQAELPQLDERQHELEKDLATVTQRLEAVRTAVASLKALHGVDVPLPDPAQALPAETAETQETAAAAPVSQPETAVEEPTASAAPESVPAQRRPSDAKSRQTAKSSKDAGNPSKAPAPKKDKAQQSGIRAARKAASSDKQPETAQATRTRTPGLSKSIVAILDKSKKPLRAGEVNERLGREKTDGSVNSVRTALERLVANRDIQRVGRGLYQAA